MNRYKRFWKRFAKIIVIIYLIVFCIPTILFLFVRTPFVQSIIVNKTTEFLSRELNTKVEIEKISFNFFLNVVIHNIEVDDLNENNLLKVDKIRFSIFNIRNLNKKIQINKLKLENLNLNLITQKGDDFSNLKFILDYIKSLQKKDRERRAYEIRVNEFEIKNANFQYVNYNETEEKDKSINFDDIKLTNLNINASNIVISDNVTARINNLNFKEKSGLELTEFSSKIEVNKKNIITEDLKLKTAESLITGKIKLEYEDFSDFKNFTEFVSVYGNFESSKLSFSDLSFFAPILKQYNIDLYMDGIVEGKVADLSTSNFLIRTENETLLKLDAKIKGLPKIEQTYFDVSQVNIHTTSNEITNILKNLGINNKSLDEINRFAELKLDASFKGYLDDFKANCKLVSNLGKIEANFLFDNRNFNIPNYHGTLITSNFDIGTLIQNTKIGAVTSNLNVKGEGLNLNTLNLVFDGNINSINLNNYQYSNITINTLIEKKLLNTQLDINDQNIQLGFNGYINFTDSIPVFNFESSIENANLHILNLSRNENKANLSAEIIANFTASNIDNFIGDARISNVTYYENNIKYKIKDIQLSQKVKEDESRQTLLKSDFFNAEIIGIYKLSDLDIVVDNYLSEYLKFNKTTATDSIVKIVENFNFKFDIMVFNFDMISDLFIPELNIAPNTTFKGNFSSKNNIFFSTLETKYINYSGIAINDVTILAETFSNSIYLTLLSNKIDFTEHVFIEHFISSFVIRDNSINYSFFWDNLDSISTNSGDLKGTVLIAENDLIRINFENSNVTLENKIWNIPKGNYIIYKDKLLLVNNFKTYKDDQAINIHGMVSNYQFDKLDINVKNFDLQNLSTLIEPSGLSLKGYLEGNLSLSQLFTTPYFTSDLIIKDFHLEDKYWGDIQLISKYQPDDKSIIADLNLSFKGPVGTIIPLKIEGKYYTQKEKNNINFTANLRNYNLRNIEPFFKEELLVREGFASGSLNITGSLDNPEFNGSINLLRTHLFVNYLNTSFVLTDSIHITKDRFYANNINISDARGNLASLDLNLTHQYLDNFHLDVNLKTINDFLFMNTSAKHNEDFYGTVFADGNVFVSGPLNDILINVIAKTGRGTYFFLPMNQAGTVSERDFISFINSTDTIKENFINNNISEDLRFRMVLDLEVTNNAEMQIIFDPKLGDIMKARGEGNLRIDFESDGDFLMFGDLNLVDGDYLFTLANVINKKFFIKPGGNIKWDGNVDDAQINLTTYYPIQTRLFDLVRHVDTSHIYRKKIPVNLELNLKNNLMSPDISFNIDLPQSEENEKNLVKSILNSEQEINRQVFALLVLRSFIAPEQSAFAAPISQGLGATSDELIYNQISNWMSQISKDFDLGVKYRRGTELTNEELEFIFSTQVFDDRLKIESNVGMTGNRINDGTNQRNQQLVGDFNAELKLTPDGRVSLRGFNRSNPFDVILQNSLYTQGVGVFIKRDFDLKRRRDRKTNVKENDTTIINNKVP